MANEENVKIEVEEYYGDITPIPPKDRPSSEFLIQAELTPLTSGEAAEGIDITPGTERLYPPRVSYDSAGYYKEKEEDIPLILEVQTTGLNPMESRIILVTVNDPRYPEEKPLIIYDPNEKVICEKLVGVMDYGKYNKIIGYNITFDMRWLLVTFMRHRIACEELFSAKRYDLMEALSKGYTGHTFRSQKSYTLDEWAHYLLGLRKPFENVEMMDKYLAGKMEDIIDYAEKEMEIDTELYYLLQYTLNTPLALQESTQELELAPSATAEGISDIVTPVARTDDFEGSVRVQCPTCLQELFTESKDVRIRCPVCGNILTR